MMSKEEQQVKSRDEIRKEMRDEGIKRIVTKCSVKLYRAFVLAKLKESFTQKTEFADGWYELSFKAIDDPTKKDDGNE